MCYTTDEYVKPKTEVTYSAQFPYGSDGYRTNCNNIPVSLQTIRECEPFGSFIVEIPILGAKNDTNMSHSP